MGYFSALLQYSFMEAISTPEEIRAQFQRPDIDRLGVCQIGWQRELEVLLAEITVTDSIELSVFQRSFEEKGTDGTKRTSGPAGDTVLLISRVL